MRREEAGRAHGGNGLSHLTGQNERSVASHVVTATHRSLQLVCIS